MAVTSDERVLNAWGGRREDLGSAGGDAKRSTLCSPVQQDLPNALLLHQEVKVQPDGVANEWGEGYNITAPAEEVMVYM